MISTLYRVIWSKSAERDLKKLAGSLALDIVNKVECYLAQSPHDLGKPLTGLLKGFYRYKYPGDYRTIYEILESRKTVIARAVGHRSHVYKIRK